MAHDGVLHRAAPGHNGAAGAPYHLHSHMEAPDRHDDLQALAAAFLDAFRKADDKTSYLRLAGVPFSLPGRDGGPSLKLVDVEVTASWQIGTAAPGFGSRELVYLPYPGEMVRERSVLRFVYVSLEERRDVDLLTFLAERANGDSPKRE